MKNANDYSGTLLKLERRKQNKGQKEVCHGICVPSYLSKIERNQVKPDPAIIRQLFQRLGIEFFCEEDFIRRNQPLIDQYFEQLTYGLEKTAYQELLPHDKELTYSPLAIDWLLIRAYEGDRDCIKQLSKCTNQMEDTQLAYYYMLLQLKKGEDDNTICIVFNLSNPYSNTNCELRVFYKNYDNRNRLELMIEFSKGAGFNYGYNFFKYFDYNEYIDDIKPTLTKYRKIKTVKDDKELISLIIKNIKDNISE
jgi:transcriptional regulator with XRE-family HTH domain